MKNTVETLLSDYHRYYYNYLKNRQANDLIVVEYLRRLLDYLGYAKKVDEEFNSVEDEYEKDNLT